jgi:hypothetical protein
MRQELADEAQRIAIDAEYLGRQHLIASEGWRRRATLVAIPATVLIAALAAAGAGVAALLEADSRLVVVLAFVAMTAASTASSRSVAVPPEPRPAPVRGLTRAAPPRRATHPGPRSGSRRL